MKSYDIIKFFVENIELQVITADGQFVQQDQVFDFTNMQAQI